MIFPSVDGQPPQVTAAQDIIQMVDETKEDIEKAVGGTVHSVIAKEETTDAPTTGNGCLLYSTVQAKFAHLGTIRLTEWTNFHHNFKGRLFRLLRNSAFFCESFATLCESYLSNK